MAKTEIIIPGKVIVDEKDYARLQARVAKIGEQVEKVTESFGDLRASLAELSGAAAPKKARKAKSTAETTETALATVAAPASAKPAAKSSTTKKPTSKAAAKSNGHAAPSTSENPFEAGVP